MKHQTTKMLFALTITTIVFSCFTEVSSAQKAKTIFFCKCGYRNYGCKPPLLHCTAYCAAQCSLLAPANAIPINSLPINPNFQLTTSFFTIQPDDNSPLLFDDERHFMKLPANSQNKLVYEMEWSIR